MGESAKRPIFLTSPHASERVAAAIERATKERGRIVIVSATRAAAAEIATKAGRARGGAVGIEAHSLKTLAGTLGRKTLAERGTVATGSLTLEAVVARILVEERERLGRFTPIKDEPGLARAIARTLVELRLERVEKDAIPDDGLRHLSSIFDLRLREQGFADPAAVLAAASDAAMSVADAAVILLDVACMHRAEGAFFAAIVGAARSALATFPAGDARTLSFVQHVAPPTPSAKKELAPVERVQAHLFAESHAGLALEEGVSMFSAPGDARESAEIARRILALAKTGVPFDEIAVLLRSPREYALALEEAFARAKVPAWFVRGTRKPDPSGRALLALLACAEEGLSATRFSEYLSLGELPNAEDSGAPPPEWPEYLRYTPPDDEIMLAAAGTSEPEEEDPDPERAQSPEDANAAVLAGSVRAPKRWEKLLVDAKVLGGAERWKKRLFGLQEAFRKDYVELSRTDETRAAKTAVDIATLQALRIFALPLLDELERLRTPRSLGEYARDLAALATRALRRPERVLAVLAELAPLGKLGKVDLSEVRLVLEPRLVTLMVPPTGRRFGRVYIAPIAEARGMAFEHVFVPGLVERGFPAKVSEDPILLDRQRRAGGGSSHLATNDTRAEEERLMLRIALGAANKRAVFSYPRIDAELARPKTPSFYALEIVRAATGGLSGFEELAERADIAAHARIGWPAPLDPKDAIDESEHDLALLARVLDRPESETTGTARYLLSANPHLARALRFRAKRWLRTFSDADGMVDPPPEAKAILAEHALDQRSFSPTALQNYAACPYRFFLYAVHKLSPREEPHAIEEMDALQKGSLVHDVLFAFLTELRDKNLLPITPASIDAARERLDAVLVLTAKRYEDELCPAIDRVWEDGIAGIRADLREWLRREAEEEEGAFVPAFFELSFGLEGQRDASDEHSKKEPVALDCGIKLRGSIDLVERHVNGALRATDYKTGKQRATEGETVIGGGKTLQPVLYALTLEKMFPDAKVESGRLYYATAAGGFTPVNVPLDERAREGAAAVAGAVGEAIAQGFLPALPDTRECEWCDYKSVCGPYEEIRTKKKKPNPRAEKLIALRGRP